ncbi:VOC family protein [Paraburkholderia sp. LEh10]|uniref:VOC family protein n=1 Tax=Paraburkholderia sp. LEh10 TaxID=2821353 RepID=UPI001AE422D3|nr:VOC family protein [Paraburkholderia sp. LEh10]MBP0589411.1 VOC family protein [Paraburkholderia sp. LEh10]
MNTPSTVIHRHHHITLCTGGAQEDYDFHTKVLSLKSVKKTALYDGTYPIYHLYYGNDIGEESTLITAFPMRQSGRKSHGGAGNISTLSLSVPVSSLDFWYKRLSNYGFTPRYEERFGEKLLAFAHPCGIEYELVGIADDARKPYSNGEVPADFAIRGTHGITVKVREFEPCQEFMQDGWTGRETASDGKYRRYELGNGGTGTIVDLALEPTLPQASWTYGEGIVHHCAFQVDDFAAQDAVKARLEAIGLTDTSERKDRGYFDSIYVRAPGGGMFEAAVSKPAGFTIDEPYESLGSSFQVPPVFAKRREEIMAFLEPLKF